ncbi:MAG: hypothetical protein AVDCRST_MAG30-2996 [uncultured Solirubrobacteraceae bacterium]|uniref:Uncharacterized protein n=1 Tax=uncultured Solirubrobacteraceae bacterium TaxID=1162706 RepID=A0A6J4TDU3_9ACTN|nr:MAG: hypothetical protein AVDCRST_MAG30-2996 [uncultured Solirubrobacteraceae bacterium]
MASQQRTASAGSISDTTRSSLDRTPSRRLSTETKSSFKTTELIAYVVAVVGVLIAAALVDQGDAGGLGARQAWLYVTVLTVGYMVSRGLAKSGSRDPYTERDDH